MRAGRNHRPDAERDVVALPVPLLSRHFLASAPSQVLPSGERSREVRMARLDLFRMERMQSRYWHLVEHDLSESGVIPLSISELLQLADAEDPTPVLDADLGYPLSEGSEETRAAIATWYPGATPANVTLMNGGSEANLLALWTLLRPGKRLAFMIPNYLQGWGLGRHFGAGTDTFRLRLRAGGWRLDVTGLERAVRRGRTRVVMVCNPNNPTGHVLTADEMDEVVEVADRAHAWIVADEIYRGAEIEGEEASPTFWGRYDKVVVTSGLSKAFAMPGLRLGWAVAPEELIEELWVRHDYTTLTPGIVSDRLAGLAMQPATRERILSRTRGIIRANLPLLEAWIGSHDDLFRYARPTAGAIAYVGYDLPIRSTELIDRIREEQSVLLVPGDMFGIGKGIRFGFGFDMAQTLKGLAKVDEVLASVRR
jgi:aspartate/methionine/tyrosine aminotransferase